MQSDPSFFQTWTWAGCQFEARFTDPVVLRIESGGNLAGLALLNRAQGRLWLSESGDPARDAAYVEHNGPLLAQGAGHLLPICLRTLLRLGRLRLAGVDDAHLAAARQVGAVRLLRSQPAPFVDLTVPGEYLAGLSANTRYQLRRSDRCYAGLTVQRAATLAEATQFLAALAELHQATWIARGKPGAFANPAFRRFHAALLARAMPRDEVDLLRIAAGGRVVGYLYNFRHRGRVLAYQSGFDYATAGAHGKPGLTCHHAAIARAHQEGMTRYDFLAGGDRYKTSLANGVVTLHWLDLAPRWSLSGLQYRLRNLVKHQGAALDPLGPAAPDPVGRFLPETSSPSQTRMLNVT